MHCLNPFNARIHAAAVKKKEAEIIKLLACLLLCCLWFLLLFSLGCFVCLFVVLLFLVASFSQQHVEGLASTCYSVEVGMWACVVNLESF